jgi:hemerythrin-like domain-containing protein
MPHPLYNLKHEHRVIERAIRALEGMSVRIASGGEVPAEALVQIVDFISEFADRFHHRKEEEFLFPALRSKGITDEGGALGLMHRQHEIERTLMSELRQAIEALDQGSEVASQLFVEGAHRYIDLLIGHIELEDSVLFRLADEVLEEADKKSIGDAFRQTANEIGLDTIEKYEKLASDLERAWAI